MARIYVEISKLKSAAGVVENYVSTINDTMGKIEGSVQDICRDWKGDEYTALQQKWAQIQGSGSTNQRTVNVLKDYAASIRNAAEYYEDAQTRALNRAAVCCK